MRNALGGAAAIAVAVVGLGPAQASADVVRERLEVSTYLAGPGSDAGATPAASTAEPLTAGAVYRVTVQGTWSPYAQEVVDSPAVRVCGVPEAEAMFAGGPLRGAVGGDAEWSFALLTGAGSPCEVGGRRLPVRAASLQLSVSGPGGPFGHPEPVDAGSGPNPQHAYQYLVRGTGARLSARVVDTNLSDNHGAFRLVVDRIDGEPGSAPSASLPASVANAASTSTATAPLVTSTGGAARGRTCSSRRTLAVHVRTRDVRSLKAIFLGRRLKRLQDPTRYRFRIDMRGLRKARYPVRIDVRYRDGRRYEITRRFYTCTRKRVSPDATTVRRVR